MARFAFRELLQSWHQKFLREGIERLSPKKERNTFDVQENKTNSAQEINNTGTSVRTRKRIMGSFITSFEQLNQAINEWIHYYNHHRMKTKLGYSPIQYRERTTA
ncbi:IS3 family transposase [Listeria monocytogenes]